MKNKNKQSNRREKYEYYFLIVKKKKKKIDKIWAKSSCGHATELRSKIQTCEPLSQDPSYRAEIRAEIQVKPRS